MNDSFKINLRFWITCNEKPLFGKGKIILLLKIKELGSLSKAAKDLKMSYRKAYYSVANMNKISEKPIVVMKRGGRNGGKTELTAYALRLIDSYLSLEMEINDFIASRKF